MKPSLEHRDSSGSKKLLYLSRDFLFEQFGGAKPIWNFIKKEIRGVKRGWALFFVLTVIVVLATVKIDHVILGRLSRAKAVSPAGEAQREMSIKQRTLILAAQMREFISDWNDSDNQDVQRENVDKYVTRFGHTALAVRDSLDLHGQRSAELDRLMYRFSYDYKDVRAIPVELEKLANRLPD